MSDLIPNIQWTDFVKIVKKGRIEELKSCEIKLGDHIFTAIIPHGDIISKDFAKTQAEYLGLKTNIVGGKDPAELLIIEEKYPNLIKARAARQAKRRLMNDIPISVS